VRRPTIKPANHAIFGRSQRQSVHVFRRDAQLRAGVTIQKAQ